MFIYNTFHLRKTWCLFSAVYLRYIQQSIRKKESFQCSHSFTSKTGEYASLYGSSFLSTYLFCRPVASLNKFLDSRSQRILPLNTYSSPSWRNSIQQKCWIQRPISRVFSHPKCLEFCSLTQGVGSSLLMKLHNDLVVMTCFLIIMVPKG